MARYWHLWIVYPAPCSELEMVQEPLSGEIPADPYITDRACAVRISLHGRLHDQRHPAFPLCVSPGYTQLQRSPADGSYAFSLLGICIPVDAPWTALGRDHGHGKKAHKKALGISEMGAPRYGGPDCRLWSLCVHKEEFRKLYVLAVSLCLF